MIAGEARRLAATSRSAGVTVTRSEGMTQTDPVPAASAYGDGLSSGCLCSEPAGAS
jgi:hypothetical protein